MGATTFALTPGQRTRHHPVDGSQRVAEGLLTMSSSYATGGDTLTGHGLTRVERLVVLADAGGYELRLGGTETAPKITAFQSGGQVSSTTDLSSAVAAVKVELWGK